MRVIFIRHGKTKGNNENRYIGFTDEKLSKEGRNEIKRKKHEYPKADRIISSPMIRCRETAEIIYGNIYEVYDELKECNFGDFENKNFEELKNNEAYIKWLENNCETSFPNGESRLGFQVRCCKCFEKIILNNKIDRIAFVVHGGTIMSIIEKFYYKKTSFYEWQIKNGECLEFKTISKGNEFYLSDMFY